LIPEAGVVEMLVERVEGNLLAATQEIEKLLLLYGPGVVSVERLAESVADSARFDSFRLVECALAGRLDECLRVASGLQRTGVAIQLVYAALYREFTIADTVRAAVASGQQEAAAFRQLGVWQQRQGPMRQALRRLSAERLGDVFRTLSLIDRQSKGRAPGDAWQTLDHLLRYLCASDAPSPLGSDRMSA
jgi:DNA polymerase-3 subunit delta